METRKLYYENPHQSSFTARVRSCAAGKKGFEIILDATCFYPEGGGQAADTGSLGDAQVLHTLERGEEVIHLCDKPLEVGAQVEGTIDYGPRFGRMQQHSGEHIVSGIIHRKYGYHNVGFHMGTDIITIDFDGVIPASDLPELEKEANRAVWENLPIKVWYPAPEELPTVPYRTKKALPWPVRIVEVPGFDICACCGTHVAATGEIGLIKLFSAIPCRGGTRMEMACGSHALKVLNMAYGQNQLVSQAFSAKIEETGAAAQRMNQVVAELKYKLVGLQRHIFAGIGETYRGKGNVLHFEPDLDTVALRELADTIADTCGGIAAVFTQGQGGFAYCLVAREGDLRPLGRAMNAALSGRGGGKPAFQQGRAACDRARIESYFREEPLWNTKSAD